MRLTSDYLADMHAIMAHVAPEVTPPPYIVRQADLPGLPCPVETAAYAQQRPCHATRAALEAASLWRGPAPVIVFVEPLCDRLEAYGRFLHELGHLLPFAPAVDTPFAPAELSSACDAYAAWAAAGNGADPPDLPRWAPYHGRDYLRVVCHLWYRALRSCCLDVPPRYVLHHEYDLSPLGDYLAALTPELRSTLADTPFSAIAAEPAPQRFSDLFEHDKAAWLRHQEERK